MKVSSSFPPPWWSDEVLMRSSLDNAIPIEGWINDPTDNDLLHILPMLEGLQYVIDVRAFLGLRRGQSEGFI